jgi:arylformamidase
MPVWPPPNTARTEEVGRLFIAALNLLMVGSVEVRDLSVFAEPHKGTRGGPSDRPAVAGPGPGRIADLSHPVQDGMITYPGLIGDPRGTRRGARRSGHRGLGVLQA